MAVNFELLRKLIVEINPTAEKWLVNARTDLFGVGALDSLAVIELIPLLEERLLFKFDFADLKTENFKNLQTLQKLLVSKYGLKREPSTP